ncbi:flagellar hook-associated protein FlgL [Chitinasiproducens palmae]|uniref:Flagellar hook-associated protein 3 FlgL n=1 Tax=Chitinasiproducens palmae TaxID=1770053 RepID=A0A1H2PLP6_9BURK|nr:flagellar hook-associated protein FlgL [Chitinasiproducens palmae]SDV46599.1 flagellar hook-associated protein 3 FlgL [Chitinasiproducens palmae]
MRIATSTIYSTNLATMAKQESTLVDLQNKIGSGKRVLTASDDPEGAAEIARLTSAQTQLAQYSTNLSTAATTLGQEDSTFSSLTTLVQQAQTLVVSAGNPSLDDSTRATLATQIDSVRDQILALANSTDATGGYLFGGTDTGSTPFASNADGSATYQGSGSSRSVQVSSGRAITVGEVGSAVFQGVQPSAAAVASAGTTNTGSVTYGAVSVTDASDAAAGHAFTLSFAKDGDATTYTVHDETTGQDVAPVGRSYTSGSAVTFGGLSVTLSGTPEAGDTVSVGPAAQAGADIFSTLTAAATALRDGTRGSAGNAAFTNTMTTVGVKLSNALDNVLTVQAAVGAREQEVTALQSQNAASTLQVATRLSDVSSSDIATAYGQLVQTQTTLEAAQKTFIQVQSLSLFDLIK